MWQLSWDQWDDRNRALYNTPLAADLSGAISLEVSLQVEWVLGNVNLPQHVRKSFPPSLEALMAQTLEGKKYWFALVRAHQELINE